MTRATFLPDPVLPEIHVNGRFVTFAKRISALSQTKPGIFEGTASGQPFMIEGGKIRGGTSRDWFVDWGGNLHGLHCTSLADAIRTIETC